MNGLVRWRRSGKAIYYVLKRLFSLRIIRNCWTNMTEMTEFVLLETVMALQQKI